MDSHDSKALSSMGWTKLRLALLLGGILISSVYIVSQLATGCIVGCSSIMVPDNQGLKIKAKHDNGSVDPSLSATTSLEDYEKKPLPSFEKGGIIFFLHIPKSGGVTVRSALSQGFQTNQTSDEAASSAGGKYILADRGWKFDLHKKNISKYAKYGTDNQELVVFELHAANSPTLMQVAERLHTWRTVAAKNDVPFFAFTVLREPVSFAISFFNFYYGMDHGDRKYEFLEAPEEKDFTRTAVFNPQCGFLVKSDVCFHKKEAKKLTHEECDTAYQTLLDNMDWIGTTDRLSNETFPLLRSLVGTNMNADHLLPENIKKRNTSPKKIDRDDLSQGAVDYIRNLTQWDLEMYNRVKEDFSFERMVVGNGTRI